MGDVFTLARLSSGHVSKHFGIGGVTHNATDVTDFVGRNQFLKDAIRETELWLGAVHILRKKNSGWVSMSKCL